jgi:O-antigen/teichoic acid export membrane protein
MNLKAISQKILLRENRTAKALNNILLSLVVKGINVAIGFVMVPLTIHYLTKYKYGIWITLSELVGWFYLFDIGLGNGFRNKFAEALAKNDIKQARTYVSTTYFVLGIISCLLFLIFMAINPFLNWTKILNCSPELLGEISTLVVFVVASFCMQFVLQLIKTILSADQKTSIGDVVDLIGKIVSFIIVLILIKTTSNSLLYMGIGLSLSPILMTILASVYFFRGKYKHFIPNIKYIHLGSIRGIVNLGVKFFVIQIAVLVQFETSNIIITQLYNPAEVTQYFIPFKYFSIITLAFGIIATPLWSAFTEAWTKKDLEWIRLTIKRMNYIWLVFLGGGLIMILCSNFVYKTWIGKGTDVPFILTLMMGMYVLSKAFGTGYVFFLNGIGKVKIQFYFSILTALLNIPLSIFFAKYLHMGLTGIVLSTWICSMFGPLMAPYQYRKIMDGTAKGIWNK